MGLVDEPEAPPEVVRLPGQKVADWRHEKARQKREALFEFLNGGMHITEARKAVGWSTTAYSYNRRQYPAWASAVDEMKARNRQGVRETNAKIGKVAFGEFVRTYFPDRKPHMRHQLWIAEELEKLGPRDVKMFLLWPEAGKTATLEDYICRHLAYDPAHRFRYVSEASDLSKRVIGTVQRRFTDTDTYPRFISKFGPFYEKGQERNGRPWTTEQISIIQNRSGERDRNLVASSWTSAVYGSRIDTLILDDLQSQRNYVQAEEIFKRVRGTFFNRGKELRTLIIGTRIGPGDFYDRMEDAGLITDKIVLPAAGGHYKGYDAEPDEPTIPEWWTTTMVHNGGPCCHGFRECPRTHKRLTPREYMEVMRHQSGAETWYASYQQNPLANQLTTFSEYLDRCLDHGRPYGRLVA